MRQRGILRAEVHIVPHGYQLTVLNYARATKDGNGVVRSTSCYDFAGTYDEALVADCAAMLLHSQLKGYLEATCREWRKVVRTQGKRKSKPLVEVLELEA